MDVKLHRLVFIVSESGLGNGGSTCAAPNAAGQIVLGHVSCCSTACPTPLGL